MTSESSTNHSGGQAASDTQKHYLRFHRPHLHLAGAFGSDGFGRKAEAFAHYFGTPQFLILHTVIVSLWIVSNVMGIVGFDVYPFILLNLAFSLQAAYAAPLILLAQTRQADRDKALAEADAQHREEIAAISERRQDMMAQQSSQLLTLLEQNTQLTELSNKMNERVQQLTEEMHEQLVRRDQVPN